MSLTHFAVDCNGKGLEGDDVEATKTYRISVQKEKLKCLMKLENLLLSTLCVDKLRTKCALKHNVSIQPIILSTLLLDIVIIL